MYIWEDIMKSTFNLLSISCFLFVSLLYSSASIAQNSEGIEEIVVTARKKEENIQETAIKIDGDTFGNVVVFGPDYRIHNDFQRRLYQCSPQKMP